MSDTHFDPDKSRKDIEREFTAVGGRHELDSALEVTTLDESVLGYTNYKKQPWIPDAVEIAPSVYVDKDAL